MRRPILAILALILALILASLACTVPVSRPDTGKTDTGTLADTGTPTKPILARTKTPASIAVVVRPLVNVRETPGGKVIGNVEAGDTVTVIVCNDSNWGKIEHPFGWVYRGCLSDNPNHLGCTAK